LEFNNQLAAEFGAAQASFARRYMVSSLNTRELPASYQKNT
jgi:hypothetical protein